MSIRGLRSAGQRAWLDVRAMPRSLRLWLTALALLMLPAAFGVLAAIRPGDKGFGTTAVSEWGILIATYVFFAVTTSGLCLASSLGTVFGIEMFKPLEKRHAILAVLCLVTAFGVIALDLHYPLRLMFGAVFSPSPLSPMWWMGVFYGMYLCFLLTEVWGMFTGHPRVHRAACLLSSVMAVIAPSTLGAVFGVLATRPFWYGSFTPPYLLVSALLSGTALLGIVFFLVVQLRLPGAGRGTDLAIPAIRLLLTIAVAVAIFLVTWQMLLGLYGGVPGMSDATRALLVGPLAPLFWGLRVAIGLLAPLVVLVLPKTRTPAGVFAASLMVFVGMFADRLGFVGAGEIAPTAAASGIVSRPWVTYSPTLVELSIVIGALAFVAFAYTLAERFLDLGEHGGHTRGLFEMQLRESTVGPT